MKRTKIIKYVAIIVFLVLIAFMVFSYQSSKTNNFGISGEITYGPISAVCKVGEECYRPYVGGVIVKSDGTEVKRFETDNNGKFEVNLRPGTYTLETKETFMQTCSRLVEVKPRSFTNVEINCDSGIR